ncbi:MAG: patatin-like phospholipase family protein [Methylococcaceae bacterium]
MNTQTRDAYRILSLDGGGSWALIQTIALADLYGLHTPGHTLLRHFDLAIANSGGSIVLAGLLLNLSPLALFRLFDEAQNRQRLFQPRWLHLPGLRKYRTAAKLNGLEDILTEAGRAAGLDASAPLSDIVSASGLATDLVICGFDYDRKRARFIRSNRASLASGSGGGLGSKISLIQAVHASSTAPVKFFDDPALMRVDGQITRFWDGAIGGHNNPVMAGVVEALANHPEQRGAIRALSLGTGSVSLPPGNERTDPGLLTDLALLAEAILDDPPEAASFVAHVMLGGRLPATPEQVSDGPVVRLSPLIQPVNPTGQDNGWQIPAGLEHDFDALTTLELDAVSQEDVNRIKKLTALWLQGQVRNQAIRADGHSLDCQIGHSTYPEAAARWGENDHLGAYPNPDNTLKIMEFLHA